MCFSWVQSELLNEDLWNEAPKREETVQGGVAGPRGLGVDSPKMDVTASELAEKCKVVVFSC